VNTPSQVHRITRSKYANDLRGYGAVLHGGRWNSKGQYLLYTASSRALAAMELAVHLEPDELPDDLVMVTINLPPSTTVVPVRSLPSGWDRRPPARTSQIIGDKFLSSNQSLILAVPSVVIKDDQNYRINPVHPSFAEVSIDNIAPFQYDARLP